MTLKGELRCKMVLGCVYKICFLINYLYTYEIALKKRFILELVLILNIAEPVYTGVLL